MLPHPQAMCPAPLHNQTSLTTSQSVLLPSFTSYSYNNTMKKIEKKKRAISSLNKTGNSLVQWLRLHASNAGGVSSVPGQGTKISACHTAQPAKPNKTEK